MYFALRSFGHSVRLTMQHSLSSAKTASPSAPGHDDKHQDQEKDWHMRGCAQDLAHRSPDVHLQLSFEVILEGCRAFPQFSCPCEADMVCIQVILSDLGVGLLHPYDLSCAMRPLYTSAFLPTASKRSLPRLRRSGVQFHFLLRY